MIQQLKKPLKPQAKKEHTYSEEAVRLLPAPISSIQVQKKNKNRYSVFVEDEFLIGVSDHTLTKFNLRKGTSITPSFINQVIEEENKWNIREYFLRLLSGRDHSTYELKTKAIRKGFLQNDIDSVLDEPAMAKYLDDERFARNFASDKFQINGWGPYKIKAELFKKGVKSEMADRIIHSLFSSEEILESMSKLIMKKKSRFLRDEKEKRRKRIFDHLMRKGYASDEILKALPELLKQLEK